MIRGAMKFYELDASHCPFLEKQGLSITSIDLWLLYSSIQFWIGSTCFADADRILGLANSLKIL